MVAAALAAAGPLAGTARAVVLAIITFVTLAATTAAAVVTTGSPPAVWFAFGEDCRAGQSN